MICLNKKILLIPYIYLEEPVDLFLATISFNSSVHHDNQDQMKVKIKSCCNSINALSKASVDTRINKFIIFFLLNTKARFSRNRTIYTLPLLIISDDI